SRAMSRLQAHGSGILLLHDVQPATALMLPKLLKELKAKGYRVVQMVPGDAEQAPVASAPPASSEPTSAPSVDSTPAKPVRRFARRKRAVPHVQQASGPTSLLFWWHPKNQ